MTAPIIDSSLRRYTSLISGIIPNIIGLAICDTNGYPIQTHDYTDDGAVKDALKRWRSEYSDWSVTRKIQICPLAENEQSAILVQVRDKKDELIAIVVLIVAGKSSKTSLTPLLMPIAECIGHEMELNLELDSMTAELTERYEELNLVYHTEDQVSYFRESQAALSSLAQNCLDYLDVGLATLILKEKSIVTTCHHPTDPIPNGKFIASQFGSKLYQWVQENNDIIVINDMSDPLAIELLPAIPYRVLCCPIVDSNGSVTGVLATVNHYSKNKFSNSDKNLLQVMARKASKIVHANYDSLTGLINRNGYEHFLESAFMQVKEFDCEKSLLHINIDQLHVINDTISFAAGDEVIRAIARKIDDEKRDSDIFCRLGGDEFGLILDDCSFADANDFAKRICREIENAKIEFENNTHRTTVSIGVASLTSASESVGQVMGVAEVACSVAKDQGRNRVESYRQDNLDMVRREEQMHLVGQIQDYLATDKFVLYSQPIVALSPDNVSHHTEILLRAVADDGAIIAPGHFIPAAERYHLMPSIDRWVVRNTLSALMDVDKALLTTGTFAINLSGQSLNESSFLEFVHDSMTESGIPAECICFEITETAAVANLGRATKFISSLQKLGCVFSLDDFGAGLSSFGYLKSLPVSYLKIDGGIVKDIVSDVASAAMVTAINEVGHAMNLQTIAEYVENASIKAKLEEIGIDYAQGYGVGMPEPFTDRILSLAAARVEKVS